MANKKAKKIAGISHGTVLARQKKDPEFQFHYVQRKFVHEVAVAIRAMRKQAGVAQEPRSSLTWSASASR